MSTIKLSQLSKTYSTSEVKVEALKDINLAINEGEFVAIVGKSGSGKSTLLNIIGCIDTASMGTYTISNENISNISEKKLAALRNKHFGFVLQYFGLIKDYTVYKNIELPLKYNKNRVKNYNSKIVELMEHLSIYDKRNNYPCQLSGGQNQRVAIARALINDPEVILADEPTGALDKSTGKEIISILQELNKKGKTIIIVTHDEEISKNCSRIIRLEDGSIISDEVLE